MNRLITALLCGACAFALTIGLTSAVASPGQAQIAKKCKKAKKGASAAKKKCKKKKPQATTPLPPTGTLGSPANPVIDTDGDGVPDSTDNCAGVSNADQADADADGHGDVCDACPLSSNPGTAACPVGLDYMNVSSPLCVGSNPGGGSVVLTGPAPADTVVSLISSNPLVATVPGTVTVLAAQTTGSFDVTGLDTGTVDITATLGIQQAVESRSVENCP